MVVFCEYCPEISSFIKDEETLYGVRYYRTLTKFPSPCSLLVISKFNTGLLVRSVDFVFCTCAPL